MASLKYKIYFHLCFLLLLGTARDAFATHNRAGEITFTQISQYTFEATLITYTDTRSLPADRKEIDINWGDGKVDRITRLSQENIGNFIWKNIYVARHTYRGPGKYSIQFFDANRVADIINIDRSVEVPFYIETELMIDPQQGFNRSPILLQPPIDFACSNQKFVHNPNAYDPDGDSLVFTLIPPKKDVGRDADYIAPDIATSANRGRYFNLNPHTGELIWDAPVSIGIYNIAILIEEFRNGRRIGYVIRDMQIIVQGCQNHPPVVREVRDTCVEAGTSFKLNLKVHAKDPDKGDNVTLTATGGPFLQEIEKATFTPAVATGRDSVAAVFNWNIDCSHIRKEPYRVVFRAVDDYDPTPLADLEDFEIKVVGPAPKNLQTTPAGNGVQLTWEKPNCADARGYYIYRRVDSSFWNHAYCETGVPAYTRFELIDTVTNADTLNYYDDNRGQSLSPGIVYCYRITSYYLNKGQFERVEGYASNEACAELKKDVPVITHASVLSTSTSNGNIYVDWSKPLAEALDTIQNPGPYEYKLYRSTGLKGQNFNLIKSSNSINFSGLNDTTYTDTLLNTLAQPYSYKVEFYNTSTVDNKPRLVGKTITASSIFLNIRRAHYKLDLSWQVNIPWKNNYYVVYKKNSSTGNWDSIATTFAKNYTDTGLVLGLTYCYKIKSAGSYFTGGFVDPIINFSQEVCERPLDTVPPCPPVISADADCEERVSDISWIPVNSFCDADVVKYKIYFSPLLTNKFQETGTAEGKNNTQFTDRRDALRYSLAGCYVVTAIDSFGNESIYSNQVCVENCPIYELPNVFTPNADEFNDLFRPLSTYRFVESVDITIVNRWGQQVFHTTDPQINWNGEDYKTKMPLSDGVYFYYGKVNEIYLNGNISRPLKGTVHLLR